MKTSEHLFYLIKSLTKSEKRSFKMQVKNHTVNGVNNYTFLFDVIDKMSHYDHAHLVEQMSDRVNVKNISTLKVQLNEMILRSLRQNTAVYGASLKIRQSIDYIHILFEKGLYSQANKVIKKAFEQAREHDFYLALDELCMLQSQVALKQTNKDIMDLYVNELYPEVREARERNSLLAEFEYLTVRTQLCLIKTTRVSSAEMQAEFDDINNHPLMQLDIEEYPPTCQCDYHIIKGHYHYAMHNPVEMYYHRKRALTIIEEMGWKKRIWLTHARFLVNGLSAFKMFEEFDKELVHLQKVIGEIPSQKMHPGLKEELEHTLNNIKINRDLDAGKFEKIMDYLDDLERTYSDARLEIDINLRMVFYANFAYAHLAVGNYKVALKWINLVLNDAEMKNIRYDIHTFVRIMQICVYYALGNYDFIRSLIQSLTRFLKKRGQQIAIVNEFLRFANNYFIEPYQESMRAEFEKTEVLMDQLAGDQDAQTALKYFDFVAWFKAYNSNRSMQEVFEVAKR